jgi:hypothetical protein
MKKLQSYRLSFLQFIVILLIVIFCIEGIGQIYLYSKRKRKQSKEPISLITDKGSTGHKQADEKIYRILVLGGSAAQGYSVDPESSWAFLLTDKLNQAYKSSGFNFELNNIAMGASTSIDDYVGLTKEIDSQQYDLVIAYNGWNDIIAFCSNPGWLIRNTESRLSEIRQNIEAYSLSVWLDHHLFLVHKYFYLREELETVISKIFMLRAKLRNNMLSYLENRFSLSIKNSIEKLNQSESKELSFEDVLNEEDIAANYLATYPKFEKDMLRIFSRYYYQNMLAIGDILAEKNVTGLFVFQPDLANTLMDKEASVQEEKIMRQLLGKDTPYWKEVVRRFFPEGKLLLKKAADKKGAYFFDMSHAVAKYPTVEVFHDTVHNTKEGSQVIAEELFTFIKENDVIKGVA